MLHISVGYSGRNCDVNGFCQVNKCLNGGTCFSILAGQTHCVCAKDFTGEVCENSKPFISTSSSF